MSENKQSGPGGALAGMRPRHENNPSPREPKVLSTAEPEEEIGGPTGPEPTRYGDWERKGRCIDF
jgi:hypothetical protein